MWILRYAAETMADISTAAYRLAALRTCGTTDSAAKALGIEAQTLRDWLDIKRAPVPR
jgi:hypothetical protein